MNDACLSLTVACDGKVPLYTNFIRNMNIVLLQCIIHFRTYNLYKDKKVDNLRIFFNGG